MLRRTLTAAGSAPSGTSRCTALPHRRGCSAAARRHQCVLRDARCRRIARCAPVGRSSCAFSTTRRCRSSSAGACSSGRTCGVPTRPPACARVPAHCASARVRSLYAAGTGQPQYSEYCRMPRQVRTRVLLGRRVEARLLRAPAGQSREGTPARDHRRHPPAAAASAASGPHLLRTHAATIRPEARRMLHWSPWRAAWCPLHAALVAVARCTAGRRGADGRRHARADGEADQGPLPRRLDLRRVEGVQLVRATPAPAPRQSRVARSPHVVATARAALRVVGACSAPGCGRPQRGRTAERRLGCAGTRASWCT